MIRLGRPTYRPDPAVVARTPGSDVLVALSVKDGERFLPEAIECVLGQEGAAAPLRAKADRCRRTRTCTAPSAG